MPPSAPALLGPQQLRRARATMTNAACPSPQFVPQSTNHSYDRCLTSSTSPQAVTVRTRLREISATPTHLTSLAAVEIAQHAVSTDRPSGLAPLEACAGPATSSESALLNHTTRSSTIRS